MSWVLLPWYHWACSDMSTRWSRGSIGTRITIRAKIAHLRLFCLLLPSYLWLRSHLPTRFRLLWERRALATLLALGLTYGSLNLYAEWVISSVSGRPASLDEVHAVGAQVLALFPFDPRLRRVAEMYRSVGR